MASTFHPFPSLPVEIRIHIWEDAIEQRIVEVHWCSPDSYTFHSYPPALLRVCHESRQISCPYYCQETIRITTRIGVQEALFNFENDILYFPYQFQCSNTYGLLLETFLRKLRPEYIDRLRHLAICLTLRNSDLEPTAETLNQHPNLSPEGRDSMTFFSNLQSLARRPPRDLPLRSITLVFNDPILQELPSSKLDLGVARVFNEIDSPDESSRKLWSARIDYCRWKLTQPHARRDNVYPVGELGLPHGTWGAPDVEIRARIPDRRYLEE